MLLSGWAPVAVLFDLDKTLTDRAASRRRYVDLFLEDYRGRIRAVEAETLDVFLERVDRDGYNPDRAGDIARELPWIEPPEVSELERHWQMRMPLATVANAGLEPLLSELRGRSIAIGVVTNGGVRPQNRKLEHLGIAGDMRAIVVSEAIGIKKPDARIFERALELMGGIAAKDTLFVGDHAVNDIGGARAVGMRTAWINGGAEWASDAAEPDLRAADLAGLHALMFG